VILRIEPSIGQVGKVSLKLDIEISRIAESVAGPIELVGPTIEKRHVTTNVLLADGELAVIGTSRQQSVQETVNSTPFLRDIPVLGRLMEAKRTRTEDVHIVFSVQARVLETPVELLAESIRQRLAFERSFARVRDLDRVAGAPYALLLDTFETDSEADALRAQMESQGYEVQVGEWSERADGALFDVYLTGYVRLIDAGDASRALFEEGFRPQIVVLPGAPELFKSPQLSQFSTGYPLAP
jgi:hypothetical protein